MNFLSSEIKNGNELAFRDFFDSTYPRVLAYLRKFFEKDNAYMDDIAQEAYVKLWQNREQIDENQALENYLFGILKNTVLSYFRTLASTKKKSSVYMASLRQADAADNNVIRNMHQKECNQDYEQVMRGISPLKQQCFRLHREYGLTYFQISEKEGIAIKTVEKYIRETSRILQSKLLSRIQFCLAYAVLVNI
ncbi:RNA polymerase sigma factor [Chitinophaga sp. 22620]|uniref:RNA polymerase sigma factor n=1 Tax=Chitinophaga sp. 22620 TaxID=3453952 RepID=UPI003F87F5BB